MKLTVQQKNSGLALSSSKGFTLVELLIVIAVIGVLAAVILAVINPLEQLARGRDAGRINTASQIGRGMQAYSVSQGGTYPTAAATWMADLVTAGELANTVVAPTNTPACGAAANQATGSNTICYAELAGGTDGVIWMLTESASSTSKVAGCTDGTEVVAVAFIASQGRAGLTCLADPTAIPAAGAVLN